MLDDLPTDLADNALLGCVPGCVLSIAIPICGLVATIAFATGHAHEAWISLAVGGCCTVLALEPLVRWLWRRA